LLRDIRDPIAVGECLLEQAPVVRATYGKDIPLAEVYDVHVSKFNLDNYSGFLMGHYTAEVYKNELKIRSKEGDIYARSTLESITKGTKKPHDPYGE
jgi:hypothetical protein